MPSPERHGRRTKAFQMLDQAITSTSHMPLQNFLRARIADLKRVEQLDVILVGLAARRIDRTFKTPLKDKLLEYRIEHVRKDRIPGKTSQPDMKGSIDRQSVKGQVGLGQLPVPRIQGTKACEVSLVDPDLEQLFDLIDLQRLTRLIIIPHFFHRHFGDKEAAMGDSINKTFLQ